MTSVGSDSKERAGTSLHDCTYVRYLCLVHVPPARILVTNMPEPTVVDVTTHEALALVCSANAGMFARLDAVFTQKPYNIV